MFESLESRRMMSASPVAPILGGLAHTTTQLTASLKVVAKIDVNVALRACVDAKVLAKLGLCSSVKVDANAQVDAIIGLCSKLKIGHDGNLCGQDGAAVDLKAVLGVIARLGVNTKIGVNDTACLDLFAKLGLKVSGIATTAMKITSCISTCTQLGVGIHVRTPGC